MKPGDLVKFHSNSWVFDASRDYANPGIILEKRRSDRSITYVVLWANKASTTEHECYLELLK